MGTGKTTLHLVSIDKNEANGKYALLVNIDEAQCSFAEEYTANQTNLAVITPGSGQAIHIHGIYCATEAASGAVSLDFSTSSKKVFRMYATKTQTTAQGTMNVFGAADEVLTLNTTTGDNNLFIIVNYMCLV